MTDLDGFAEYMELRGHLDQLKDGLTVDSSTIQSNIDSLVEGFDDRFPRGDTYRRGGAEVIIKALMKVPLSDYLIGHHASAIVSTYAVSERFFRPFLASRLARDQESLNVLIDTFQRSTLKDYARILIDLDILDDEDYNIAKGLADLRNGIAHHNETLIANRLRSGADLSVFEAMEVAREEDSADHFFDAVHLMEKAQSAMQGSM